MNYLRCEAALHGWRLEFKLPGDICIADWQRALTAAWPADVGDAQQQTAQAHSHLHPQGLAGSISPVSAHEEA